MLYTASSNNPYYYGGYPTAAAMYHPAAAAPQERKQKKKKKSSSSSSSLFSMFIFWSGVFTLMLLAEVTIKKKKDDKTFQAPPPADDTAGKTTTTTTSTTSTSSVIRPRPRRQTKDTTAASSKSLTFTAVVVRCHDPASREWLDQIPSDWNVVVYEKCQETSSPYSIQAANVGAEECSTYAHHLITHYHNLTDYTVFLHGDALQTGRYRQSKYFGVPNELTWGAGHTPFDSFYQLVDALHKATSTPPPPPGILHLGTEYHMERFGSDIHGKSVEFMWKTFISNMGEHRKLLPSGIGYKKSAHFAVHKSAVQLHSLDEYKKMKDYLMRPKDFPQATQGNVRNLCFAMERLWHVWFGADPILPSSAILTDVLNMTQPQSPAAERMIPLIPPDRQTREQREQVEKFQRMRWNHLQKMKQYQQTNLAKWEKYTKGELTKEEDKIEPEEPLRRGRRSSIGTSSNSRTTSSRTRSISITTISRTTPKSLTTTSTTRKQQ